MRRIAAPVQETSGHRPAEAGEAWKDNDLVFANTTGGPLDPAAVHRNHQILCDIADVRYIRFHGLRHTCATLLLEREWTW